MNRIAPLLVLSLSLALSVTPISAQDGTIGSLSEIDSFSYRVSFRTADGAELLLIRARFQITYLYQRHQPSISQHYLSGAVGFYFGKTALGRSLVQEARVQRIEFRPQWHDALGYFHGPESTPRLFTLSNNVSDGQMVTGSIQLDMDAVSRYLPDFGGVLVIQDMVLVLDDGSEIVITNDTIEIEFEKNFNRVLPDAARVVHDAMNHTSTAADGVLTISLRDAASAIVLLDLVAAVFMMVSFVSIAAVVISNRQKLKISCVSSRIGRLRGSS